MNRFKIILFCITEAFGFVFLGNVFDPATQQEENIVNLGLKDQQMAFKWAKDNIQNFDGDSSKVNMNALISV